MYINGQGVEQDFVKGAELLERARVRGHQQARVNLQGSDFTVVMKKKQLRQIQQKLKDTGAYNGAVDGAFGEGSKAALERFQDQNKLKPNGLTLETLDRMGLLSIIPKFSVN